MTVEVWQIHNLQGRLAGWRPREELKFGSKGNLLLDSFLLRKAEIFVLLKP